MIKLVVLIFIFSLNIAVSKEDENFCFELNEEKVVWAKDKEGYINPDVYINCYLDKNFYFKNLINNLSNHFKFIKKDILIFIF